MVMSTLAPSRPTWWRLLLEFVSRMSHSARLMAHSTDRTAAELYCGRSADGIMRNSRRRAATLESSQRSGKCSPTISRMNIADHCRVLSKLKPEHAHGCWRSCRGHGARRGRRMLRMERCREVDRASNRRFAPNHVNLSQTRRRDAHDVMAEIFNNFDRQTRPASSRWRNNP